MAVVEAWPLLESWLLWRGDHCGGFQDSIQICPNIVGSVSIPYILCIMVDVLHMFHYLDDVYTPVASDSISC